MFQQFVAEQPLSGNYLFSPLGMSIAEQQLDSLWDIKPTKVYSTQHSNSGFELVNSITTRKRHGVIDASLTVNASLSLGWRNMVVFESPAYNNNDLYDVFRQFRNGNGTTVKPTYIGNDATGQYAKNAELAMVTVQIKGQDSLNLSFIQQVNGYGNLTELLTPERITELHKQLRPKRLCLAIPQFKVHSDYCDIMPSIGARITEKNKQQPKRRKKAGTVRIGQTLDLSFTENKNITLHDSIKENEPPGYIPVFIRTIPIILFNEPFAVQVTERCSGRVLLIAVVNYL